MVKINSIVLVWGILFALMLSLFLFPHAPVPTISILTNILLLTLFVICLFIVRREKVLSNKIIFLNFLLFSAYFLITSIYPLTGFAILSSSEYARHYHYLFGTIYYHVFLLLAVTYLVVDMLFRNRGILIKYGLSVVIVGFVSYSYYGDFLKEPKFLYTHPDVQDFSHVYGAVSRLAMDGFVSPSAEEIAGIAPLKAWSNGKPVGELYESEKIRRVEELLPYLEGQNWLVLLMRPLNKANVYINTFIILLIFLFFAYQYKKDPPQGAYIEKIMFLILIFVSLESLHSWAYVRSVEWNIFLEFFVLGQYLSMTVLALITLFFGLRLRFISTVQGEFYEQQLVSNPQRITRWRDWVDNFVLSYIFNSQTLVGRLLAPGRTRRS